MEKRQKVYPLLIGLMLAGADQLLKWLMRGKIGQAGSIPVIENVFHLTEVWNTGSLFGMLKGANIALIVFSMVVLGVILYLILSNKLPADRMTRLAVILLIAGTVGNLVDRIQYGAVYDFLDFRVWPVFNLADMMIVSAVVLLIFQEIRLLRTRPDPQDPSDGPSP